MRIILEKIDDEYYGDIILTDIELDEIQMGEMIEGAVWCDRRRYYLGVRLRGDFEYDVEEIWREEE